MFGGETIEKYLDYIGSNYQSQDVQVTDYEIHLAKNEAFRGCDELGCGIKIGRQNDQRIKQDYYRFIHDELGKDGSDSYNLAHAKAEALTKLASKFRNSAEEYYNSNFYKEENRIMTAESIDEIEEAGDMQPENKPSPGCSVRF